MSQEGLGQPEVSKPIQAPELKTNESPYKSSRAGMEINRRKEAGLPIKFAFVDIDSTLTGNGSTPESTAKAVQDLEKHGYVVVINTARTAEMQISDAQRTLSPQFQESRPAAKRGMSEGKYVITDPANVEIPQLLDHAIIIDGTGSGIYVQQAEDGYQEDLQYRERSTQLDRQWQSNTLGLVDNLRQINPHLKCKASQHNHVENYQAGVTNVYPLEHRVQLDFDSLADKQNFLAAMEDLKLFNYLQKTEDDPTLTKKRREYRLKKKLGLLAKGYTAEMIDQYSHLFTLDDSNEKSGRFSVYLLPPWKSKAQGNEHLLKQLASEFDLESQKVEVLNTGDSWPDVQMMYSGLDYQTTTLIVGGSRVTKALTSDTPVPYAGEDISVLRRGLRKTEETGVYDVLPGNDSTSAKLILGDQAYPGTVGPETISAHLESLTN